jgi:hypothetical protein
LHPANTLLVFGEGKTFVVGFAGTHSQPNLLLKASTGKHISLSPCLAFQKLRYG